MRLRYEQVYRQFLVGYLVFYTLIIYGTFHSFGVFVKPLAQALGIGRADLRDIITASLECTRDYHQRVAALRSLPDTNKQNLIAITRKTASMLETVV